MRQFLELVDDLLQPLLEIAAVTGAGEQRAHVERIDDRGLQDLGHVALDDLAREALGDRGLPDAGVADVQRVVLAAAAQDLDRAVDLRHPADQRIDLALLGLFVEVDGELLERALALGALGFTLGGFLVVGAFGGRGLDRAALADAVADEADRIEAAHVLLLQEIDCVALALGEQGDQHVGAGDLVAARRLDVQDRALDHALKPAGRRRVGRLVDLQRGQLGVEIVRDGRLQLGEVDVASFHYLGRMLIVDEREQQVLQRRIFVTAGGGRLQRLVEGGFERGCETGHACYS